jgi:hypothetical protein
VFPTAEEFSMNWTRRTALKNRISSRKTTPKPNQSVIAADTGGAVVADGGNGDGAAAAIGAMAVGAGAAGADVCGFGIGTGIETANFLS